MKRFVRSDTRSGLLSGAIIFLIVSITHASLGVTYLISLGVFMIWMRITFGPFHPPSWRTIRRFSSRHPGTEK